VRSKEFKDKVCIVGVGHTDYGVFPGKTSWELGALAFKAALEDCGIAKDKIDGLIVSRIPHYGRMATILGLKQVHVIEVTPGEGRQSSVCLQYAAGIIASGQADTVALVYGNDGKTAGAKYGGGQPQGMQIYDYPYGFTSPGACVGMMFRRHQHLYGTTSEQLAEVAINNRLNAQITPWAVMKKPLDLETYMAGRFITEPLRLYDYCLINDGGVALILTTAERARDMKKPPVYISATATATDMSNYYMSKDMFYSALQDIAKRLYPAAGITRADVKCAQIYDNFTPTVLYTLEGLGFCPRGAAGAWIQGGRIRRGGELPLNTSGSHTSESYMQGWALHVEAVRQVRGECGERQVPNCDVAQFAIASPICASTILTRR
jgi:acetyl-CoA acetyltransferase